MFRGLKSILDHPLGELALVVVLALLAGLVCSEIKSVTTGNMSAEAVALRSFNQPRPALWERVK